MKTFVPFILSAAAGAFASKLLLLVIKRDGPFFGLFISWLFISLLALCTPYQFLCALLFGFLFVKVTDVEGLWPFGILAVLLFWWLHPWLSSAIPELLRFAQNELYAKWYYLKTGSMLARTGDVN